ncbi:MAG: hypothetical protein EOL93_09590 [Epsilonproteobacteria bacterium]|nr:hypothetical protein [Campylobacterota bacterium]
MENNPLPMTSGVDSLYFHYESSLEYDELFIDIVEQLEDQKDRFARNEMRYQPHDLLVTIADTTFNYLGFAEGYYWFRDHNEFFKIGFKDKQKQRRLHDIRVQLQGKGIYTLGITSMLDYIDSILEGYTTGLKPIIRADINAFVQYDFSFVDRSMFVTRKKNYATISEIGDATTIQTLYVGKPPFMLRLYNKTLEMKKSKKEELMREYLANYGFDLEAPIFNVEFQMHRPHLKAFGIQTVDDLFLNVNNLFKSAMDEIRLIDTSSISENGIEHNNKHRAQTLPIWEQIKEQFDAKEFLQIQTDMKRIKRIEYLYDYERFQTDFNALMKKAYLNCLFINEKTLVENLERFVKDTNKVMPFYEREKSIPVEIVDMSGNAQHYKLQCGELKDAKLPLSVTQMDDVALVYHVSKLENEIQRENISDLTHKQYKLAYEEAIRRKLINRRANEFHFEEPK